MAGPAPRNGRPTRDDREERTSSARHLAPEQASLQGGSPSRWAEADDQSYLAGDFGDAAASSQHRSGLPIRQPRSVTPAPLSPSGSLWERAESAQDASPADATDTAGRPIFVWDQERPQRR
jgi:hypothetical protein